MGHDFITLRDRHVLFRDWEIWTLRHFLYREASGARATDLDVDEPTLRLLRSYVESWDWIGPGVVTGTDLTAFIQDSPERQHALSELFKRTITRLECFGEVIPDEYLPQHLNGEAFFAAPQPTERYVRGLRKLLELVS